MREVKFRILPKYSNEFEYFNWNYNERWASDLDSMREETLGQFIGIKDKNGDDIYDGDVVKCTRYIGGYSEDHHIGIVEWNSINLNYYFKSIKNEISRCVGGKEVIEVLGNIHLNPELLHDN